MGWLIKPVTAPVNSSGNGILTITHSLHGLVWKVYQVSFALGHVSLIAQAAAHFNGVPLAPSIPMQQSAFTSFPGQAPYAMEASIQGPPYVILSAGDQLVCAIINATANDTFTAAAYIDELDSRLGLAQDAGR